MRLLPQSRLFRDVSEIDHHRGRPRVSRLPLDQAPAVRIADSADGDKHIIALWGPEPQREPRAVANLKQRIRVGVDGDQGT
jgi:hypothetical protein